MSAPALATTRAELSALLEPRRRACQRVGFVPTMGALHEGHASLVRAARQHVGDGPVVVSVFVNPTQFGDPADLERYPRTLEADLAVCEREGVDVVFAPAVAEMYPRGTDEAVWVKPGPLAKVLEGRTRKGHYRGVLTVVAKLLGLVRPDVAVFGQKDYQQLVLIRRMVDDLCLGVEVVGAETVREPDGLALSSRNVYLSAFDRAQALALSRALFAGQDAADAGPEAVLAAARSVLAAASAVDVDYLELTDPELGAVPASGPARLLVAARVGGTRLIDNVPVTLS